RAEARTAGELVEVVGDVGEPHQVLARDAALRDAHACVAELLLDGLLDRTGVLAPEVRCVVEGDLVFLDGQVDGLLGLAVDDDPVPTGALELGAPETTSLSLAVEPGQRRLRPNRVPAGA